MTEDDIRKRHSVLIRPDAEIAIRKSWLPLVDEFLSNVRQLYGDTQPSVRLNAAYESDGLVIDLDDTPWSGNQDPALKQKVRKTTLDIHRRSRDV